ncbi:MAG: hypothetical protein VX675_10045 [Planctomycetota bacterium]|nr:hypothetical protein [Planctomycetota bacterium]
MKAMFSFLTVLVLVGLSSSPLLAQNKGKRAKGPSLFSTQVKKAVPGIDAVVSLSDEQKAKYAEAQKAMVASEAYAAATKTIKNKDASKEDRKAASTAIKTAKAGLADKLNGIIGADNATLVKKVNAVVASAQKDLRSEYRAKFKEAKNDKEATAALRKEMTAKVASVISEKVHALLSDAQKEAIKKASTKGKGKGKKKREKKGKKKEEADNS